MTAVGKPRATSPAKLGPDRTAAGAPGKVSASTSVISFIVPRSTPLEHSTTGTPARWQGAKAVRVARICWAGGTARIRSHPPRSARSDVKLNASASGTPGR